ncbi:Helix-turn-helix domain-containing protein [Caloranaerobacter azorensis DSM 13643]|uniref:Helix-turn-helix domain-containing protein n=1 Tax=Caloranaerobacter azorensis DSM 13643 TaxID=1121264 RepID=A0A1M5T2S4_9FIRM|nr:helix-turn-helix transcriptional regulator [Caloranaerobacter azorensis]SHH45041.1 Helix-turn-helix domain-containing protein [Caloranaerobacter azorensis DSM 13643]
MRVFTNDYEVTDKVYILEDTILPTNEKIRAIRKFLKINQKELAGDNIDRSLISYIENGKVKLSNETAKILASNLSRILKEKNLNYQVDADYLLADEKKQASYRLNTIIEILKNMMKDSTDEFLTKFYMAEELLRKWDIPSKKAAIYDLAGDYFFNKLNYYRSEFYYMMALGNYFRLNDYRNLVKVCTKIVRCLIKRGEYEEAISLNDYAMSIIEDFKILDSDFKERILFNNSLALFKMELYEESLNCLDKLILEFDISEESKHMDILLLKANIYNLIGKLEESLEIYKQLLELAKQSSNLERMAIAYNNIGAIYHRLNNIEQSIKFLKKSLRIRRNIKSERLVFTIKSIINILFDTGEYNKSKIYLFELLSIAKKEEDISLLIETYCRLMDVFLVDLVDIEDEKFIDEMIKFVRENREAEGIGELIAKLCKYFVNKDIYKIRDLFDRG